jgi:hypothetical protein
MPEYTNRTFKTALQIDIAVSRTLRIFLLACYSLSAIVCLTLSLDLVIKSVICVLSATYGVYLACFRYGLRNPSRIKRIEYSNSEGWRLSFADGKQVNTSLRLPVFITPFLVIVRFGKGLPPKYTAVIPADAADCHTFRHLRVRLLQSAHGDRN